MDIIEYVKNNKFIYKTYSCVASLAVNILKLFVKTDDKLILFVSYGGRHFNDSPKCIYDMMKQDLRFADYKLVWAFRNPEDKDVENKIKIDTLEYYVTALKARCWVTNVIIERGLSFKGKNTYYFHTTHTTLPKFSGNDETNASAFGTNFKYSYDCSCAQSEEEKRLQQSMFSLRPEQILVCGYPKNDILACASDFDRDSFLSGLGISPDKTVILYAPTYRENPEECEIPIDFEKWQKELGDKYVVLFRAHPVFAQRMKIEKSSFVCDVSSYPDNMKLMMASDMLISDYSGIFFEYAILNRPMFCYAYDYDEYIKTRGMYMDLRRELPSGTQQEILAMIKADDKTAIKEKVQAFRNKYVTAYGNATQTAVDNIYEHIKE